MQGIVHWYKCIVLYWKIDTHSLIKYFLSSQVIIFLQFLKHVKVCLFLWILLLALCQKNKQPLWLLYSLKARIGVSQFKVLWSNTPITQTLPVWRFKSFSVKVTKQAMLVWDLKPFSDMAACQKPAESWLCG